jgi:hypothetical protein
MSVQSAKRRGSESQRAVADYLRDHGWPYATPTGAGEAGPDIHNTPGVAVEVKGRKELRLPQWLRQAQRNADGEIPLLVSRGNGQGPSNVAEWAAIMPLGQAVELLQLLQALRMVSQSLADRDDLDDVKTFVNDHLDEFSNPVQVRQLEAGEVS